MLRTPIERRADQRFEQAQKMRDRVVGPLRIGDMALPALRDERAIQRAAPADLDHIAERFADWSARQGCNDRTARPAHAPSAKACRCH